MPDASGKICIRCGEDCSNKQRSKNAEGNYICADCLAKIKARQPAPPPLPGTKPVAGPGPAVAQPRSAARGGEDQGVLGKLIDESVEMHKHGCPNCHAPMKPTQILCVKCGFNKERGKQLQTVVKKAAQEKDVDVPSRYAKSRRINKLLNFGGMAVAGFTVLVIILMGGLFLMALGGEEIYAAGFVITWLLFGGVLWLVTIVAMFMDEIVKGILGLFIPLYTLYWVWAESENSLLQMSTIVNILGFFGLFILMSRGSGAE